MDRVINHQRWLWERAIGKSLEEEQENELRELRKLMHARKATVSGRTLWLGGTEVAKRREASQFNCSFLRVATVYDMVDAYWLLLQGCGVGFEPITGTLNGFSRPVKLNVIRSRKTDPNDVGVEKTSEKITDEVLTRGRISRHWTIRVGDSAEAWSKLPGKLLAQKQFIDEITLDFSEIRPAGVRLKSYGWISSGDEQLAAAMPKIVDILNNRAGMLLTRIDILDILNWLGTTLSSRRSAEICLLPYGDPEWIEFTRAKRGEYWRDNPQRAQSNNTLMIYCKPSLNELTDLFNEIMENGGSDPGIINAKNALLRAPWFRGVNPCAEILLGDKSFCNLVELDLAKFNGDYKGLLEAVKLIARANYRQTCVNLDDGILQRTWHELNDFLRLCGTGVTGIVRWEYQKDRDAVRKLKATAKLGAISMADELRMPRPKAVTTVKPSGTIGKIMDTSEGVHKPLGRYIFNNVKFSVHDPIVRDCREAGYRVMEVDGDPTAAIVTFPVSWSEIEFDEVEVNGETLYVNNDSAIDQLNRYLFWLRNWADYNPSVTISYDKSEAPAIVEWLHEHWDEYVAVSFLFRDDPTKTAKDLGFQYLPQEVVSQRAFTDYVSKLKPIRLSYSQEEIQDEECATGACPVR